MHVSIEWKMTKYPTFTAHFSSKEGAEPFFTIYDCRIVDGKNGPFVSYPARKDESGKYWGYARGSEKFNAHVLERAQAAKPAASKPKQDEDSDIPF